jgi:hypothetical protein
MKGAQTLATAADDMLGDLIDQRNRAVEASANRLIDCPQFALYQRTNSRERFTAARIDTQLSVSPRECVV